MRSRKGRKKSSVFENAKTGGEEGVTMYCPWYREPDMVTPSVRLANKIDSVRRYALLDSPQQA
jgi:hypothetical protein